MCWAETLRAAALPAMESIEGMVYFHSVQLDREIRKLHSEGISLSQPGAAGRVEAGQRLHRVESAGLRQGQRPGNLKGRR